MVELVGEGAASLNTTQLRVKSVDIATVEDLYWADGIALASPTLLGALSHLQVLGAVVVNIPAKR